MSKVKYVLPTERSTPLEGLARQSTLLYGPPKIGKTTFASEIPDCIILDTEAGTRNLSVYREVVDSWDKFRDVVKALVEEEHSYKTVVVDTIDRLYTMCLKFVGRAYNFGHPSDQEYGKGWDLLRTEFLFVLNILNTSGLGFWMISHSKDVSVTTRTSQFTKTQCTLSGHARGVVHPMVEIMMYAGFMHVNGREERVLQVRPEHSLEVGDKTTKLLRHPYIPLRYAAMVEAFDHGPGEVNFTKYLTNQKKKPKVKPGS